jgi:arylsulfatase A-like enzyme
MSALLTQNSGLLRNAGRTRHFGSFLPRPASGFDRSLFPISLVPPPPPCGAESLGRHARCYGGPPQALSNGQNVTIDRREFIIGSSAAAMFPLPAIAQPKGPNFLFIIIDDLLSVVYSRTRYGTPILTPNLDALSAGALRFDNAFASTALCGPSRAAILSGQNPFKTGIHNNQQKWFLHLETNELFPVIMSAAGWDVSIFGKIVHNNPERLVPFCSRVFHSGNTEYENDDEIVRQAISHLNVVKRPFMMMVGLRAPHGGGGRHPEHYPLFPLHRIDPVDWSGEPPITQALDGWLQKGVEKFERHENQDTLALKIRNYLASVKAMDDNLGVLLGAISDDTIVILTSDHGYALGEHDFIGKFSLWDEAGRAPLVIRYLQSAGVVTDVVSLLDIAPTVLRMAGLPIPETMDGWHLGEFSVNPLANRQRGAMTSMGGSLSLRRNRYRITRYSDGNIELYDQISDPLSLDNLVNNNGYRRKTEKMMVKLQEHARVWGAPFPAGMT